MRTPCGKNLGRDKERTTGAEDTQNQNYQGVRTVADSCHGRTDSQWQRNSADRDPCVPVDTFDHHAASTFTVVFGTAIPEALQRLPCLCIATSVNNNCFYVLLIPKLAQ